MLQHGRRRFARAIRPFVAGLAGMALLVGAQVVSAQERPFPYTLSAADAVVLPVGSAASLLGIVLRGDVEPLTAAEIAGLERNDVNGFDRGTTYNWSEGWQDVSDGSQLSLIAAAGAVSFIPLVLDGRWSDAATLGVIFAETVALTTAATNLTKVLTQRKRPYVYNDALTPETRAAVADGSGSATLSFFSGHSSVSFATAALLSTTFRDIHGPGTASTVVTAGSLSLAALTALARVEGGMHFPTDVLVGSAVGAAIGHLVPRLHRRDGRGGVRIVTTPEHLGLRWVIH